MRCGNNLKQLALASHGYYSTHGTFPAGTAVAYPELVRGLSLFVVMMPYYEIDELARVFSKLDGKAVDWSLWVDTLYQESGQNSLPFLSIPLFKCPSFAQYTAWPPRRDYYGNVGGKQKGLTHVQGDQFYDGMFHLNQWYKTSDITDGTSKTFAIGEGKHPHLYGGLMTANDEYWGNRTTGGPVSWGDGSACSHPCTQQRSVHSTGRLPVADQVPHQHGSVFVFTLAGRFDDFQHLAVWQLPSRRSPICIRGRPRVIHPRRD